MNTFLIKNISLTHIPHLRNMSVRVFYGMSTFVKLSVPSFRIFVNQMGELGHLMIYRLQVDHFGDHVFSVYTKSQKDWCVLSSGYNLHELLSACPTFCKEQVYL